MESFLPESHPSFDYDTNLRSIQIKHDRFSKFISIPREQYRIQIKPQKKPLSSITFKQNINDLGCETFVKDCVSVFNKNLTSIKIIKDQIEEDEGKGKDNQKLKTKKKQQSTTQFNFGFLPKLNFEIDFQERENKKRKVGSKKKETKKENVKEKEKEKETEKKKEKETETEKEKKKQKQNVKKSKPKQNPRTRKGMTNFIRSKTSVGESVNKEKNTQYDFHQPLLKRITKTSIDRISKTLTSCDVPILKVFVKNQIIQKQQITFSKTKIQNLFSLDQILYGNVPQQTEILKKPYQPRQTFKFLFEPLSLQIYPLTGEQFYCHFSVYDCNDKKKLIETWHFDMLPDLIPEKIQPIIQRIQRSRGKLNLETNSNRCYFELEKRHPDIWAVIRIERLSYKRDPSDVSASYTSMELFSQKVGIFWKPYLWCAFPILTNDNKISNQYINGYTINQLFESKDYITDKEVINFINEQKNNNSKKQKMIKSKFLIKIYQIRSLEKISGILISNNLIKLNNKKKAIMMKKKGKVKTWEQVSKEKEDKEKENKGKEDKGKEDKGKEDKEKENKEKVNKGKVNKEKEDKEKVNKKKLIKENEDKEKVNTSNNKNINKNKKQKKNINRKYNNIHQKKNEKKYITKICETFLSTKKLYPNLKFTHNMYIYPKKINLSSKTKKSILIKIQIKENDDNLFSKGLNLIYGRTKETNKKKFIWTNVQFHKKSPRFNDEIKIQFPFILNSNHHILFTIYSINPISMKKKNIRKNKNKNKKNYEKSDDDDDDDGDGSKDNNNLHLIGYGIINLYKEGRPKSGKYNLDIFDKLPKSNYLKSYFLNKKKETKSKTTLKVITNLISTIFPEDDQLWDYFKYSKYVNINPQIDPHYIKASKALIYVPLSLKIQYLLILLKTMFKIIIIGNLRLKRYTFRSLLNFINQITNNSNNNNKLIDKILKPYIDQIYDFVGTQKESYIFEEIVRIWNHYLEKLINKQRLEFEEKKLLKKDRKKFKTNDENGNENENENENENGNENKNENGNEKRNDNESNNDKNKEYDHTKKKLSQDIILKKKILEEKIKNLLKNNQQNKQNISMISLKISWFLFALLKKSMMIYKKKLIKKNKPLSLIFSEDYLQALNKLISNLKIEVQYFTIKKRILSKELNWHIAFFMNQLFNIIEVRKVFQMINNYLSFNKDLEMVSNKKKFSFHYRFKFLIILSQQKNFIRLNLPIINYQNFKIFDSYKNNIFQPRKHFLIDLILFHTNNIFLNINNKNKLGYNNNNNNNNNSNNSSSNNNNNIQNDDKNKKDGNINILNDFESNISNVITLFQSIFLRCDFNDFLKKNILYKKRILTIYFPLIKIMINNFAKIKNLENNILKNLLIIILYLLKNIEKHYFNQWWLNETMINKIYFFKLLQLSINTFEYFGKKKILAMNLNKNQKINSSEFKEFLEKSYSATFKGRLSANTINGTFYTGTLNDDYKGKSNSNPKSNSDSDSDSDSNTNTNRNAQDKINDGNENRHKKILSGSKSIDNWKNTNIKQTRFERYNSSTSNIHFDMSNTFDQRKTRKWITKKMGQTSTINRMKSLHNNINNNYQNNTFKNNIVMKKDLSLEKNISNESSKIVLEILIHILTNFYNSFEKKNIKKEDTLLGNFFQTIFLLFQKNQSNRFIIILIKILRHFLHYYKKIIFKQNNQLLLEICREVFFKAIYQQDGNVRKMANTFLYLIFMHNYETFRNLKKIEVIMIIILRQYVGTDLKSNNILKNYSNHQKIFETWKHQANSDGDKHPKFKNAVLNLIDTLSIILKDAIKINLYKEDPWVHLDLIFNLANKYKNVPDLRISFLENIYQFHLEQKNHAEAGIIQLHFASMIIEYLNEMNKNKIKLRKSGNAVGMVVENEENSINKSERKKRNKSDRVNVDKGENENENEDDGDDDDEDDDDDDDEDGNDSNSADGVSNMDDDYNGLPKSSIELMAISQSTIIENYKKNNIKPNLKWVQSKEFSQQNLITSLQVAITHFQDACLWEKVCETSKILNGLFEYTGDYLNLSKSHNTLKAAYDKLIAENFFYRSERMIWQYYRVGFYGQQFAENDGVEYIYKVEPGIMITEFCERLKKLTQLSIHNKDNDNDNDNEIEFLFVKKKIDQKSLKKDKLYLLVHSVEPYFSNDLNEDLDKEERLFNFQKINDVNQFTFQCNYTRKTNDNLNLIVENNNNDDDDDDDFGGVEGVINDDKIDKGVKKDKDIKNIIKKKKKDEDESMTETFSYHSIVKVKYNFPFLITRQKIIDHSQSLMSPIEFSIQMLKERTQLIKTELTNIYPYSVRIQQLLSGTLLPQVNEGIIKIAQQFLSDPKKNDHKLIKVLKVSLIELMKTCEIAIKTTKFKAKSNQNQLHQAIINGYNVSKDLLKKYILGKDFIQKDQTKVSIIVDKEFLKEQNKN
ncbi:dedicator of cytokinesis dock [Anaeramoeba flamelloides]|uniref:Dedicator of cytokinesis dock n=1 Tax=Anaeramoeba flamelloides TaxID=1746091 RepID=A0AAV8A271_9EUKA|nr:dedicator of cytokinesis dock [Anaeramoeba flamelloides]